MKTHICRDSEFLADLQRRLFPSDEALNPDVGVWWVVMDGAEVAAFAALRSVSSWAKTGYMARCGVLPAYRGHGLQRHLITTREKAARRMGMVRTISTTYNNPASANNLIARGYRIYEPTQRWGARGTIYWLKNL